MSVLPPAAIASGPGQRVYRLVPWVKGLVFPLPFPARDAQPTASKQSGQERAFSCCEGTRGLSLMQAERGRASLLQVSLQEGKGYLPGPFLSIGVLRRCCWDLLSWKGKSQLISWLPVFPLFGRWIRASRMLAGVVPPQGRGLPCWWGGSGWCPQRDGLISFTARLGSTNTRLDL